MIIAAVATINCGRVPSSPSPTESQFSSETVPTATGQVVGIGTFTTGISDVVITGVGLRAAHSDAKGFFSIDKANSSTYSLVLTHPNFIERRTAAILPASGLHVSMIPLTFDQAAFEELAPRATVTGLRRWIENPSLTVLTNVVNYDAVAYDPVVTDRRLSDEDFSCMRDGVERAI